MLPGVPKHLRLVMSGTISYWKPEGTTSGRLSVLEAVSGQGHAVQIRGLPGKQTQALFEPKNKTQGIHVRRSNAVLREATDVRNLAKYESKLSKIAMFPEFYRNWACVCKLTEKSTHTVSRMKGILLAQPMLDSGNWYPWLGFACRY